MPGQPCAMTSSGIQALRSLVNEESQSGTGRVDFAEPEEHRALRTAVAGIAAKFGPRYYAERAAARRPCAELWQALGDAGFIGVNIPEEYGGGGGGLIELALVCEEIAAAVFRRYVDPDEPGVPEGLPELSAGAARRGPFGVITRPELGGDAGHGGPERPVFLRFGKVHAARP